MCGSGGGTGGPDPPPPVKYKNIRFLSNIVRIPLQSQSYQSSIQCWAIIGPPVKRHLNGVSLAGRRWSGIYILPPLIKLKIPCQSWTPSDKNFLDPRIILISSLPGKVLRTFVESRGLPSDFACFLKAEPGKFDIKRREPGACILFTCISLPIVSDWEPGACILFTCISLPIVSDYNVIIDMCVDSSSLATSYKKCNFIMT